MSKRNTAPGTAIAVVQPGHKPRGNGKARPEVKPTVEQPPAPQSLMVPAALLLACETCSATKGPAKPFAEGVYLHAKDGRGRAVATDGVRLFVGSFALPKKDEGGSPNWLNDGLILSNLGLRERVSLMQSLDHADMIRVTYAKGNPSVTLSDPMKYTSLLAPIIVEDFPDYERLFQVESFGQIDESGRPIGREWRPIGVNSQYLKKCGDVADALETALKESAETKHGMVIRMFTGGSPTSPVVFSFEKWPGAVLFLFPIVLKQRLLAKETALVIAPAAKLTIAALRAHATRNRQWAAGATTEVVKAAFLARATEFDERVRLVIEMVPGAPGLVTQEAATRTLEREKTT
jgi:hypothetical protein